LKDEPLKTYFVNSSANLIAPTSDSTNNKFYDLGLFQLCTQGNASSSAEIGELYVTYSFTMIRPKQQTPAGQNFLSSHWIGASQTTANPFLNPVQVSGSNVNMSVTGNQITINTLGRYNVNYLNTSTTCTFISGFTTNTGCAKVTPVTGSTLSASAGIFTAGSGTAATSNIVLLDVTTVPATFTMSMTYVGGLLWDLFVTQVPGALTLNKRISEIRSEEHRLLADRLGRLENLLSLSSVYVRDCYADERKETDVSTPLPSVNPVLVRSDSRRLW